MQIEHIHLALIYTRLLDNDLFRPKLNRELMSLQMQ